MAAGQGFKTFTTGEVLTAGDVNGYLMQGVLVFASAAARDAAITSPQEGQFAFTKDTNGLWYYDGAAWVASGATGDIEGVTAGVGISGGGTSGTVTVTNSMATAIDAKGDLVAGTGADTFAKLTVGANDTILTADSTTATGLKWAAAAGGGGGPSFAVYGSAAQNGIANQTFTKVALNTEVWDTDSCYDTTLYRFTPNKSGYYQINTCVERTVSGGSVFAIISLYKNGTSFNRINVTDQAVNMQANSGTLVYLNGTTDYIEWFVYLDGTSTRNIQTDSDQITTGVWIRS